MLKNIYCWGRNKSVKTNLFYPNNLKDLQKFLVKNNNYLPFGNGRSYGDVCLNSNNLISMKKFCKILNFDKKKGIIEVESGMLLSDLLPSIIKEKWFMSVTPGSKYISLGGMLANNVHGKNVKKNFFSDYIISFNLINSNGTLLNCSKNKNKELFYCTIGGLGLTGVVTSIKFKLKKISSVNLIKKTIFFNSLEKISFFDKLSKNYDYSVSWLDGYSKPTNIKGIFFLTKHDNSQNSNFNFKFNNKKINIIHKIVFNFFNNYLNYRFFNFLFKCFHFINFNNKDTFENFFYVQDKFIDWNRLYGKKGFVEFHILVPDRYAINFLKLFFTYCQKHKIYSNLIVLKRLKSNPKYLNFYGNGLAISCDFKIDNNFYKVKKFFLKNSFKYNYSFYLAKDSQALKDNFILNKGYHNLKNKLKKYNKNDKFKSNLTRRIGIN